MNNSVDSDPATAARPWRTHPIAETLEVRATAAAPSLPPEIDEVVEAVWKAALRRHPGLFNGRIFSADRITPTLITGHWTEYRRHVAQLAQPGLHPVLGVRSLAVQGILHGPDGIAVGRRNRSAIYQPGRWQLPPAGSVDPSAEREGRIDLKAQLLGELEEELGLDAGSVRDLVPVGLVEHAGSHVLDLGLRMWTDLGADHLLRAHGAANTEYEELRVLRPEEILALPGLMPTVPIFLDWLGRGAA